MTHDNGWDVSPSWQEVRAERDVLIAELRGYKRSYENVMAERDALAAHVERLASRYATHDGGCDKMCGLGPCSCGLDDLLEDTPTASLAHRDVIQQALSLSRLMEHLQEWMAPPHEVIDTLEGELRRLRRQASGDDS